MTGASNGIRGGKKVLRVGFLTIDNREHFKDYSSPQPYFGTAPEALLEGFKLIPQDIEVHIVSCLQKEPISSPARLAENIYYHALKVPNIGWLKTGYQGCIRAVRKKLREISPDIVHGQGTERDCAVSAVYSGFPNVLTLHGNMARIAAHIHAKPLSYYWFAKHLERWCLRKTNGGVAISTYTEKNIRPYAERTWLIPNAVHPDFFRVERSQPAHTRVLCVANINHWKNQVGLIKALDPLHQGLDFELRLAGGLNSKDTYAQHFLRMIGERSWCNYLGSTNRTTLMRELSMANVVVLPSFEDNCPMVILEAKAAGVPVAASRIGGIPDLIQHGQTGLLFDPNDSSQIEEAIRRILSDRLFAAQLSENARIEASKRFDPRVIAKQHVEIYQEVLN
jgi:glycosyltransferase involved in cell wall biosynthesis